MSARRLFTLIGVALLIPAALAACGKLSSISYSSLSENPPSDLTAKATSSSSAHLKWKAPISGASAGYDVYRSDEGGPYVEIDSFDIGNSIDNSIVNSPIYDDTGLNPGELYCYEVSSYDAGGVQSKKSNSACISTPGISAIDPANLSTGIPVINTVTVTFTDIINGSTISPSNFTMIVNSGAGIGNPVTGSVSLVNTRTVRFTPANPPGLLNGTTYLVTIGSGVLFGDGSELDGTYIWKFTTAP